ncbi:MAG: helix-turn-helix transcriptional regulator [Bacteroidia bacterium]
MLNTDLHIVIDESRLKAIEESIAKLIQMAEANNISGKSLAIGDWVHEDEVYRLLKIGRTSLWRLRKEGILSSSSIIDGKGTFYRLSEIEELLYARQEMKK